VFLILLKYLRIESITKLLIFLSQLYIKMIKMYWNVQGLVIKVLKQCYKNYTNTDISVKSKAEGNWRDLYRS
jgi:hypothetical protein